MPPSSLCWPLLQPLGHSSLVRLTDSSVLPSPVDTGPVPIIRHSAPLHSGSLCVGGPPGAMLPASLQLLSPSPNSQHQGMVLGPRFPHYALPLPSWPTHDLSVYLMATLKVSFLSTRVTSNCLLDTTTRMLPKTLKNRTTLPTVLSGPTTTGQAAPSATRTTYRPSLHFSPPSSSSLL